MAHQFPGSDEITTLERSAGPLLLRLAPGVWAWARERFRRAPPEDFRRQITLRLRDQEAITLDLSTVPSVNVWFEVLNLSHVDVVLDRIVVAVRVGQPVLDGVMAHRYLIPGPSAVSTILFSGQLTEGAAGMIRRHQEAVRSGSTAFYIQVTARAYFESTDRHEQFAIEGQNLGRPLSAS